MHAFTLSALGAPRDRSARQQRRLLLVAAALVTGYVLLFAAAGVYRPPALASGLLIPLLLGVAAWRLPGAGARQAQGWSLAVTVGMSAIAVATAALSGGTECIGFHVVWALPLVYTLMLPQAVGAVGAGAVVAFTGGLALLVRDGRSATQLGQWILIAAAAGLFAVVRTRLQRREQRTQDSEADVVTAQLAVSEERYRLLAENSHDVIWTMDPATGRFTYVSPSVLSQRGFTVEEVLRQTMAEALLPESLERARGVLARLGTPEEEDPHTGIYDQPCRDGSVKHIEIRALARRDPGGRPREIVGVSRDVTRRVDAERELRRSEQRFRALIEKSSDMILVLDRQARIQFWSAGATEALGWTLDEVVGRTLQELQVIHPDDAPALVEALGAVVRGVPSGSVAVRVRHRHLPGAWRLVEGLGRNFLDDPAVQGVVINARDVTEQRDLEARVHQAQKLESIGRLAGGLAHDFNNVLTVMLSCAESAQQAAAEGGQVDPEDLAELRGAGERARDLTRQLLAFARKRPVAPEVLDLDGAVRASERLLRRVLGEDLHLRVTLQATPATVVCDPGQLDQVLLNLAVNARDAMPGGGTLTIETRPIPAAAVGPGRDGGLATGDWVELLVRDTGAGMSQEVQDHLFEPFFTTKARGEGTGLGLATVYGIVRQAGGQIRVESELGRGSAFHVYLPCRGGLVPTPRPAALPAVRGRGTESLLVVEDDPLVRSITERTLRRAGYQVVSAGGGEEALRLTEASRQPPALVVTDVVMPGLGGREVAEALRGRFPGLRVLFVSGYASSGLGPRDLGAPRTAFLAKPFTAEGLLRQVRALLDA